MDVFKQTLGGRSVGLKSEGFISGGHFVLVSAYQDFEIYYCINSILIFETRRSSFKTK